jgi:hypothetical protein
MLSNLRRLRVAAGVSEPGGSEPPPWEPRQLTTRRQELDHQIILLASAETAAAAASKPVERLTGVIAEYEGLAARVHTCYATDRAELARLIADGDPGRSYTSPETEAANSACAELREACEAARHGLPAAEKAQAEAIAAVAAATMARDEALLAVAEEACEELYATMVDKLNAYLGVEAQLRSVAGELRGRGNRGDNAAHRAATAIEALVQRARQSAGVPPVPQVGPQLLEHLARDPTAGLPL